MFPFICAIHNIQDKRFYILSSPPLLKTPFNYTLFYTLMIKKVITRNGHDVIVLIKNIKNKKVKCNNRKIKNSI